MTYNQSYHRHYCHPHWPQGARARVRSQRRCSLWPWNTSPLCPGSHPGGGRVEELKLKMAERKVNAIRLRFLQQTFTINNLQAVNYNYY